MKNRGLTVIDPTPPALVPVAVAADLTGVSVDAIYGAIADGTVKVERIKRRLYVDLEEVSRIAG